MDDFVVTSSDNGGVHYNSGIPNHAAYLLMTSTLPDGTLVLEPDEVARMYYFVLTQLTENAQFSDCRTKLVEVVKTVKQGDPDVAEIVTAVERAYDAVGIR